MNKLILGTITILILWVWALCSHAQTVEVYNAFGKTDDATWKNAAKQIFICGPPAGRWLTIGRINTSAPDQRGFEPNFTYVLSKYLPIVRKLPNGCYEITFTSEFTKNLP